MHQLLAMGAGALYDRIWSRSVCIRVHPYPHPETEAAISASVRSPGPRCRRQPLLGDERPYHGFGVLGDAGLVLFAQLASTAHGRDPLGIDLAGPLDRLQ